VPRGRPGTLPSLAVVCRYGRTVNCLSNVIPSNSKELDVFTSAPSRLMVMLVVSFALALPPTITCVLAPLRARPLSFVYLTMALTSRCSSLCASSISSATTQTVVSSA
jgi:hypothetical protein